MTSLAPNHLRATLVMAMLLIFTVHGAGHVLAQGPGDFAVPVETAKVEVGPVEDTIATVGDIIAQESLIISPEIAGRINSIGFTQGERVNKGQVLFTLDDAILAAELADATASLELSKRNHERSSELLGRRFGTERTRDETLAALQSAEAKVALARARLDKTRITAPFDSVAGLRRVSVGAFVSIGEDLVRLVKTDPAELSFRVPERFLRTLYVGQRLEVRVDAYPDQTFAGTVFALDNVLDINGRSIEVRARIPNPAGLLRPGLFARVSLVTKMRETSLIVPEAAIVPTAEKPFVYRVIDGKASQTPVELGLRMPGMVEVLEGLSEGDVVVTAGQQKIRDGSAVQPVEKQQPAPATSPETAAATEG